MFSKVIQLVQSATAWVAGPQSIAPPIGRPAITQNPNLAPRVVEQMQPYTWAKPSQSVLFRPILLSDFSRKTPLNGTVPKVFQPRAVVIETENLNPPSPQEQPTVHALTHTDPILHPTKEFFMFTRLKQQLQLAAATAREIFLGSEDSPPDSPTVLADVKEGPQGIPAVVVVALAGGAEEGLQSLPAAIDDAEEIPQSLPAAIEDTEESPQSLPAAIEDTEESPQSLPAAIDDTEESPRSLPAAIDDTEESPRGLPAAIVDTEESPRGLPANTFTQPIAPILAFTLAALKVKASPPGVILRTDAVRSFSAAVTNEQNDEKPLPITRGETEVLPTTEHAALTTEEMHEAVHSDEKKSATLTTAPAAPAAATATPLAIAEKKPTILPPLAGRAASLTIKVDLKDLVDEVKKDRSIVTNDLIFRNVPDAKDKSEKAPTVLAGIIHLRYENALEALDKRISNITNKLVMKNTLDVRNKIVALHKSKSDPAKLAECLYFTNQLLTSSPGLEREARAAQYRLLAKRIPEKSSLLWQALGCAMIILGASMVTLGTICLMTTIPGFGITTAPSIGLATAGMGLLNLGLFTRSHHESAERKMQRLSSVVNREEPGMILSN